MKKLLSGVGFVCLFLVFAMPLRADDDFSGQFLDPDVWQELDIDRYVDETEDLLISGVRSARQGDLYRNACWFPSPASIYGVRSKIRMSTDTDVVQNSSNNAEAGARIIGSVYNRDSASPSSRVGDVIALVEIRERGTGLEAWFEVIAFNVYPASGPSDYDVLLEQRLDSGGLSEEVFYSVQLEYDSGASEIRAAVYDASMVLVGSHTYTVANYQGPAYHSFLELQTFAFNDTALASADFDDVYTQSSPGGVWVLYDDFNSGFDHSKWGSGQIARNIDTDDEHLVLGISDDGNLKKTVKANLVDLPDYLEAMVTLSSDTFIENETDNKARFRLEGIYYNDKNVPYDGLDGDCFAQVRIEQFADGSFTARCGVYRSENADFSAETTVWSDAFDASAIALGVPVKMVIEYTGTAFNFQLGSQTKSWTIVPLTAQRAANQPHRALAARIYDNEVGGGSVAVAFFDDVKTTAPSAPGGGGSSGGGGGGGCFISTSARCEPIH
jgi:hypothetical protein